MMLYLLQVLFTPATQAARQAACTIVEALTTIPSRKQQVLDLLTRYGSNNETSSLSHVLCYVLHTNKSIKGNMADMPVYYISISN